MNMRSTLGYFGSTLGYVVSTLEYIGSTLGHSGSTWVYDRSIQVYTYSSIYTNNFCLEKVKVAIRTKTSEWLEWPKMAQNGQNSPKSNVLWTDLNNHV